MLTHVLENTSVQVMWSTFEPYLPHSILPSIIFGGKALTMIVLVCPHFLCYLAEMTPLLEAQEMITLCRICRDLFALYSLCLFRTLETEKLKFSANPSKIYREIQMLLNRSSSLLVSQECGYISV